MNNLPITTFLSAVGTSAACQAELALIRLPLIKGSFCIKKGTA